MEKFKLIIEKAFIELQNKNDKAFCEQIHEFYENVTCGCYKRKLGKETWEKLMKYIDDNDYPPTDCYYYLKNGFIYLMNGKEELAFDNLKKAIDLNPMNDLAFALRSQIEKNINYSTKDDAYKALELNPSARNYFLYAHEVKGQEAIMYYTKAIELNNGFACAYNNRGILYGENKEYELELNDYLKCIEVDPFNYYGYNSMASIYLKKHDYINAIHYLKKSIKIEPVNGFAFLYLGKAYAFLENVLESKKYYNEYAVKMNNSSNCFQEIRRSIESVCERKHQEIELELEKGNNEKVIELYFKLTTLISNYNEYELIYEIKDCDEIFAINYLKKQDYKNALLYAEKAIQKKNSAEIYLALAESYLFFENIDESEKYYQLYEKNGDWETSDIIIRNSRSNIFIKLLEEIENIYRNDGFQIALDRYDSTLKNYNFYDKRYHDFFGIILKVNGVDISNRNDLYARYKEALDNYINNAFDYLLGNVGPDGLPEQWNDGQENENNKLAEIQAYGYFSYYNGKKLIERKREEQEELLKCLLEDETFCLRYEYDYLFLKEETRKLPLYFKYLENNYIKQKAVELKERYDKIITEKEEEIELEKQDNEDHDY